MLRKFPERFFRTALVMMLTVSMLAPSFISSQTVFADDPPRVGETPEGAYDPEHEYNSHLGSAAAQQTAIANALGLSAANVSSISDNGSDHNSFNVFTTAASGFPTQGTSYAIMSTGCTSIALNANTSGSSGCSLGGINTSAGRDLSKLSFVLIPPTGASSLSFKWKFFSEEYPEYVGSSFNDTFLVQKPDGTNIAFDSAGNTISINSTGVYGMSLANAFGTTYDGGTQILTTTYPFTAGSPSITLHFSIFDQGDDIYDTAVFLDQFVWSDSSGTPVTGIAPTSSPPGNQSTPCNTSTSFSLGSFTDPDGGPWTVTVNWGDGSPNTVFTVSSTGSLGNQSHTYTTGGTKTVTVTVKDSTNLPDDHTFTVNVGSCNAPPTVDAGGPYSVDEGSSVTVSGTGTDPNGDAITYSWDLDNNGSYETSGQSATFSAAGLDGPASYTIGLQGCDPSLACSTDSAIVNVLNVAPSVVLTGPSPVAEGSTHTYNFSVTDPGQDTFTASTPSCGSSGTLVTGSLQTNATGGSFDCAFADGPSNPTLQIQVTDSDGAASNTAQLQIVVNNVAPTVSLTGPASAVEGSTHTYNFTVTDPGQDTFVTNLVSNGSFEQPAIPFGTFAVFGSIPGWTTTYGCGIEIQNHVAGNPAPGAGDQFAELDSHCPSGVSQQIPTVAGETYTLSFLYTPRPGVANNDIQVKWNGAQVVFLSGSGGGSTNWVRHNFTLTATGSSTALEFNDVGPNDSLGGYLDDISVSSGVGASCGAAGVLVPGSLTNTGTSGSFQCTFPDGAASTTVSIQGTDTDAAPSNISSVNVSISNVAPTIALSGAALTNEGSLYTLTLGNVVDPGKDTVSSYAIDWGDGTVETFSGSPNGQNKTHVYADGPNNYTIGVSLTDEDGTFQGGSKPVQVDNVNPTATINGAPVSSPEGTPINLTSTVTDPGNPETFSYSWTATKNGSPFATGNSSSFSFTPDDNGTYVVGLTVDDGDGGTGSDSKTVTVTNVDPTATINGAPATSPEGTTINLTSTVTDPGSADTHSYAWSVTKNGSPYGSGSASSFSFTPDDNGSYVVSLTVTDDDGGTGSDSKTITGTNVNPTATINGAPATSPEGTAINLTSTVTDPGSADTHSYAWSVTKNGSPYGSGSASSFSFTPDDNGSYVVSLTVTDDDGGPGSDSKTITGTNVAPTATTPTLTANSINENGSTTVSGSFSDPGSADTFTVVIDWGDGSADTTLSLSAGDTTYSATHQYLDDNPTGTASDSNTVSVTVEDDDGGSDSDSTSITVGNVAPVITGVIGPTGPLAAPATTAITVNYTDVGTLDTHSCVFSWDDASSNTTSAGGSGSCSATHTYASAGVYAVGVTVTDDDTGSASSVFQYVVVYDPGEGFVTGGGWIMSPQGAYSADPTLTGKANFGFVSKYQKGANVPTGNTEFQFHAGGLNFHSTSYEWLVVAGHKAQYKGEGTVNGVSGYKFIVTATDGQQPGGGGVDKFRIKIWNDGGVLYDNKMGSSDDIDNADPQAISGGSIVIHDK